MTYIAYLIGTALLVWALLPLFKKDSTWISLYMETEELAERKQRVYGNIADLEFDYAMGRLSEKDFTSVRKSFLNEAGIVIRKIEEQKSSDLMNRILDDVKNLDKKKKKQKKHLCSGCGSENLPEAKFCMKCGKELS